jgi:CRP/FNR family transcriptional regulator, anaerobic regulatory protein
MTIFSKLTALIESQKSVFEQISRKRLFKKGEIIVPENRIADKLFIIESGYCRSFFLKDGDDITDFFFFEDSFATDFASFYTNKLSSLNLICEEEVTSFEIHKTDLEKLYQTNHQFSEIGRLTAEYAFSLIEERVRLLHTENLETKYNWMIQNFPSLFQRVPQHYIASFLGVKPQSLSRIRAKISGKIY